MKFNPKTVGKVLLGVSSVVGVITGVVEVFVPKKIQLVDKNGKKYRLTEVEENYDKIEEQEEN